jgi:hypothetical protein
MEKFSMAMGITLLNRAALFAMTLAQMARESKSTTCLSNNGRGWNQMSPKK